MPIFEFECGDCGHRMEILVGTDEIHLVSCGKCGSRNLKKLLSAPAAVASGKRFPENAPARCCGADGPPSSCEGPGSCCGRR
ncbi:MAG: zinc ribbon domain-containing protein [Deltaproteobacteria bacterium]|nr:MAG: zinc ribbon domain-containing protein [Deltaproteobacteria bacterium]